MKIILSGGGTLGPVAPLLAIIEAVRENDQFAEFVWIGTSHGPERELIAKYHIPFFVIASGKLRRYFSLWNFLDVFSLLLGFLQSLRIIIREKPDLVISAGGFVSVPLHVAAFMLSVPAWVHQQDVRPGLANKIMAKFASKVTTALEGSVKYFNRKKTEWIGNPARNLTVESITECKEKFGLPLNVPVIFATGGGTGSKWVNELVIEALPHWPADWQVLHLVGKERPRDLAARTVSSCRNYHMYTFFAEEMKEAYAVADVVIARAGFGTITELADLGKPAVLIPMSETHQVENARLLSEAGAAIEVDERSADGAKLAEEVTKLINDKSRRQEMVASLQLTLPIARKGKILEIIKELVK